MAGYLAAHTFVGYTLCARHPWELLLVRTLLCFPFPLITGRFCPGGLGDGRWLDGLVDGQVSRVVVPRRFRRGVSSLLERSAGQGDVGDGRSGDG